MYYVYDGNIWKIQVLILVKGGVAATSEVLDLDVSGFLNI